MHTPVKNCWISAKGLLQAQKQLKRGNVERMDDCDWHTAQTAQFWVTGIISDASRHPRDVPSVCEFWWGIQFGRSKSPKNPNFGGQCRIFVLAIHGSMFRKGAVCPLQWVARSTETHLVTSAEEGGYVFSSVCLSVCLSVCQSDYSQTCERILTKFFVGVGRGSRTKWYNFCGNPDHASDPGVQSPKSGSSGLPCSAEVCALWAYLVS